MAYDKVIDSSVLDANLTSVANAIRSKGGTSASLAFPAGFINAISQMETGKVTTEVHEITFASDLGNGKNTSQTLLTNNAFIKKNISNDSMTVILVPVNQPKMNTGTIHFIYHGNRNIGASNSARTGVTYKGNNTSALGYGVMTGRLDGENYNASFYADSTGKLNLFVASALVVKAGTYVLTLLCGED